jgi:hypothetical protein
MSSRPRQLLLTYADSLRPLNVHCNTESGDDNSPDWIEVSLRPRFAGEGRLRLPASVQVLYRANDLGWARGDIVGDLADAGYDPFERVASGLLLAEDFARVDLSDRKVARPWYQEHGVLDLAHFFPADAFEVSHHVREDPPFHDAQVDVLQQQENVRWHLLSLARLSDYQPKGEKPLAGWTPGAGWEPRWAQPALRAPSELVWLGGSTYHETHISPLMQRAPRPEGVFGDKPLGELTLPHGIGPAEYAEWWSQARSAYEKIVAEGIPMLWVPEGDWAYEWSEYDVELGPPSGRSPTGRLSSDWWGLVELERRLLASYVRRAAEYQVEIRRAGFERDLTREGESLTDKFPAPLVVYERRWWSSLLAPVYLQLLEGLRRVTEGQRGAAFCRECGQPFLTLDARRSSFCTDRERYRFSQRERRRRLSVETHDSASTEEIERIEQEIEERTRADRAIKADIASAEPWLPDKAALALRRRKNK